MVELIHNNLDLLTGYILKATTFDKVLSYQSIGVLIQTSLPSCNHEWTQIDTNISQLR